MCFGWNFAQFRQEVEFDAVADQVLIGKAPGAWSQYLRIQRLIEPARPYLVNFIRVLSRSSRARWAGAFKSDETWAGAFETSDSLSGRVRTQRLHRLPCTEPTIYNFELEHRLANSKTEDNALHTATSWSGSGAFLFYETMSWCVRIQCLFQQVRSNLTTPWVSMFRFDDFSSWRVQMKPWTGAFGSCDSFNRCVRIWRHHELVCSDSTTSRVGVFKWNETMSWVRSYPVTLSTGAFESNDTMS